MQQVIHTAPKPFAFVLMPLAAEFDDVYQLGIKPACAQAGAYAERVDEQLFSESILERIYNQLAKADVIIADMTQRNPNVFYETGYAHALNKPVVLLTQDVGDIPFDLKHFHHIIYGGRVVDLIEPLERRVRYILEHEGAGAHSSPAVEAYWDGMNLADNPTVRADWDLVLEPSVEIRIDLHQPLRRRLVTETCEVGIITSRLFSSSRGIGRDPVNVVSLPDGNRLHLAGWPVVLAPGGWQPVRVFLRPKLPLEGFLREEIRVRVFSEAGPRDFNFFLELEQPDVMKPEASS